MVHPVDTKHRLQRVVDEAHSLITVRTFQDYPNHVSTMARIQLLLGELSAETRTLSASKPTPQLLTAKRHLQILLEATLSRLRHFQHDTTGTGLPQQLWTAQDRLACSSRSMYLGFAEKKTRAAACVGSRLVIRRTQKRSCVEKAALQGRLEANMMKPISSFADLCNVLENNMFGTHPLLLEGCLDLWDTVELQDGELLKTYPPGITPPTPLSTAPPPQQAPLPPPPSPPSSVKTAPLMPSAVHHGGPSPQGNTGKIPCSRSSTSVEEVRKARTLTKECTSMGSTKVLEVALNGDDVQIDQNQLKADLTKEFPDVSDINIEIVTKGDGSRSALFRVNLRDKTSPPSRLDTIEGLISRLESEGTLPGHIPILDATGAQKFIPVPVLRQILHSIPADQPLPNLSELKKVLQNPGVAEAGADTHQPKKAPSPSPVAPDAPSINVGRQHPKKTGDKDAKCALPLLTKSNEPSGTAVIGKSSPANDSGVPLPLIKEQALNVLLVVGIVSFCAIWIKALSMLSAVPGGIDS